jgi:hypothetical protein
VPPEGIEPPQSAVKVRSPAIRRRRQSLPLPKGERATPGNRTQHTQLRRPRSASSARAARRSRRPGSNRLPAAYKAAALPVELRRRAVPSARVERAHDRLLKTAPLPLGYEGTGRARSPMWPARVARHRARPRNRTARGAAVWLRLATSCRSLPDRVSVLGSTVGGAVYEGQRLFDVHRPLRTVGRRPSPGGYQVAARARHSVRSLRA